MQRSSPCGDVSWNTKTLTADQAKERSSPYGDVNWNRASSCACMSRNTIRLLVGMWVEICWRYIWTRYQNVRLRKETWVEIYVFAVYFISSFSSSPCGDVSWNHKVFRVLHNLHRSSPYGDVSWNIRSVQWSIQVLVRLLTETWVEISSRAFKSSSPEFVSLRRRELKLLADNTDRSIKCSSPCGDVSWNIQPKSTLGLTSCSSPCGDVNWNGRIPCPYAVLSDRSFPRGDVSWNCSVFAQAKLDKSSSPYGDVNWNEEASKADYFNDVRLRKETWIEI